MKDHLTAFYLNRIKSQLGLSDTFTILGIDKRITSSYPPDFAKCDIPEQWYLVTAQDEKKGLVNGFVWLENL